VVVGDDSRKGQSQVHRLESLEVSSIGLLGRPAIDMGFLVPNRHNPDEQEEVAMTKEKIEYGEVV
jgi:hypothetical protein